MAELNAAGIEPGNFFLKTANSTGYMRTFLSEFSQEFCDLPASESERILEIGGGVGNVIKALLQRGATSITAVDPEPRHLQFIGDLVRPTLAEKPNATVTTIVDRLPELFSVTGKFDKIVCAQVLHYLRPTDFERALKRIDELLAMDGLVLITLGSPYNPKYGDFGRDHDEAKRRGDPWPGYMQDPVIYNPSGVQHHGGFWLFMDADMLAEKVSALGLRIVRFGYEDMEADGRVASAVIARKSAA